EIRHGAKARNDLWGIVARDMDDLADVEVEGKAVRRAHGDGRELLIQLVRLGFSGGPVEDDVGRGHDLHFVRERVDGVFAGIERIEPDAFFAAGDEVPVFEAVAGEVLALFAHVGDDDTNVGDGDFGHGLDFDGGEARIDEVAAGEDDLFLQAFVAAGGDEAFGILEEVVAGDLMPGNFARGQRLAVLGGNDADHVVGDFEHVACRHLEERSVDAVGAGRDDGDLRAALAAAGKEGARVLEGAALHRASEYAAVR